MFAAADQKHGKVVASAVPQLFLDEDAAAAPVTEGNQQYRYHMTTAEECERARASIEIVNPDELELLQRATELGVDSQALNDQRGGIPPALLSSLLERLKLDEQRYKEALGMQQECTARIQVLTSQVESLSARTDKVNHELGHYKNQFEKARDEHRKALMSERDKKSDLHSFTQKASREAERTHNQARREEMEVQRLEGELQKVKKRP